MKQPTKGIFSPGKARWLLDGGLDTLDAGERQVLLAMAETAIQDGREPTEEEKEVIRRLRAERDAFDGEDVRRKVDAMVHTRAKPGTGPLKLPPEFDRFRRKHRRKKEES